MAERDLDTPETPGTEVSCPEVRFEGGGKTGPPLRPKGHCMFNFGDDQDDCLGREKVSAVCLDW